MSIGHATTIACQRHNRWSRLKPNVCYGCNQIVSIRTLCPLQDSLYRAKPSACQAMAAHQCRRVEAGLLLLSCPTTGVSSSKPRVESSLHSSFSSSPQLATCESKARPQRLVKAFLLYSQLPRRRQPRFESPPCHRPLNAAAVLHYICVSSRFSSRFFTLFDNREKSKKKITFFPQLTVSHLDVFKNIQWLFIFLVWKNKYISSWDPTPWQTSACLCGVALPEGLDPPNKTPSLSLNLRLVSKTCQSECLLSMVLSVITACCCHYK